MSQGLAAYGSWTVSLYVCAGLLRCQCDECRFNRGLRLREGNRRVYHRVCDRLGLQPSGEVNEQLSQLGAVVQN
eukprot:6082441-Amphidinium_carterae.1